MKLLIDTNIILDVLAERHPHYKASSQIWNLCEMERVEGIVSALSIADIVYIMRKELDNDKISMVYSQLDRVFLIGDLRKGDIAKAVSEQWDDFEDSLQNQIASRYKADYIITRNTKDYSKSEIKVCTPKEFIENYAAELFR